MLHFLQKNNGFVGQSSIYLATITYSTIFSSPRFTPFPCLPGVDCGRSFAVLRVFERAVVGLDNAQRGAAEGAAPRRPRQAEELVGHSSRGGDGGRSSTKPCADQTQV